MKDKKVSRVKYAWNHANDQELYQGKKVSLRKKNKKPRTRPRKSKYKELLSFYLFSTLKSQLWCNGICDNTMSPLFGYIHTRFDFMYFLASAKISIKTKKWILTLNE